MLNKLSYYLLVIVAIMVAACSDVEEILTPAPDQSRIMSFNIGNQTKVSTADITSQEFIIYDYIYGASSEGYPDGTCYIDGSKVTLKYRNGRWDFYSNIGDTRVDFLWTKTGEHRFYAYNDKQYTNLYWNYDVSYNWNGGNPIINLGEIDLTDGSNLYSFDLVYANATRNVQNDGYNPIDLQFSHAFSSLLFEIKNEDLEPITIKNVSISNIRMTSGKNVSLSFASGLGEQSSGADVYSSGEFTIDEKQSAFAFGGSILAWPQWYQGSHPFFTLTIKDNDVDDSNDKSKIIYLDDINIGSLISGKKYHSTITLTPDPVELSPEVIIDHIMQDGGTEPEYSTVSISLNPTGNKLGRLENLRITVLDSSGNPTGLEYSSVNVIENTIEIYDQSIVLTPGEEFTVRFEYNDKLSERSNEVVAMSPLLEPEYNYVYADGTQGNEVRNDIVGVIIYLGNPREMFNDLDLPVQYCNGLAISTKSYLTTWGGTDALPSIPSQVKLSSTTANYDQGGYGVKKILNDAGLRNLPIYNSSSYVELPSGKTSGWYIGAKNEWSYIYDNLEKINGILSGIAGADKIEFKNSAANGYWLPLNYETSYYKNRAIVVYGGYYAQLTYTYRYNYTDTAYARPIFAF